MCIHGHWVVSGEGGSTGDGCRVVRVGEREGEIRRREREGRWAGGMAVALSVGGERELVRTGSTVFLLLKRLLSLAIPGAAILEPHLYNEGKEKEERESHHGELHELYM